MNKKLIIALIAAILLITAGVIEEIFVEKTFNDFSEKLGVIEDTPDEQYSLDKINELHDWWENKRKYMELFLPHVQLNEIEITYGELIGAVEAGDFASASALLNRIHATSDAVSKMYNYSFGNIF